MRVGLQFGFGHAWALEVLDCRESLLGGAGDRRDDRTTQHR
jgi:hypothetical protein